MHFCNLRGLKISALKNYIYSETHDENTGKKISKLQDSGQNNVRFTSDVSSLTCSIGFVLRYIENAGFVAIPDVEIAHVVNLVNG